MTLAYPSTLPCVSRVEGHSAAIAAGLVRTPMEAGNARQRRAHHVLPQTISLVFVVAQADYAAWLSWVNANAYDGWITLLLPGLEASRLGLNTTQIAVRFSSDIQADLVPIHRRWYWRCRVTADYQPPAGVLAPIATGPWIVADFTLQPVTWPAPTVRWNFAGMSTLPAGFTCTRAATAAYFDATGTLVYAPVNVARFDHDPVTLAGVGLLVESAATNLLLRSDDFTVAPWTKSAGSVTGNVMAAPDGAMTADKFVEDSSSGNHDVTQTPGAAYVAGTSYTFSVFVKPGERSQVRLTFSSALFGASAVAYFDVAAGTVVSAPGGGATITKLGNGWVRCALAAACQTAGTGSVAIYSAVGGASNYPGDGASGLYLWGAQVEATPMATSYIPTTAATVTRPADVVLLSGPAFTSWWRPDEGAVAVVGRTLDIQAANTPRFFMAQNAAANELVEVYRVNDSAVSRFLVQAAGVNQVSLNIGPLAPGALTSIVVAYKLNNCAAQADGGAVVPDNVATMAAPDRLYLGGYSGTPGRLNGWLASFNYYAKRLPLEGDVGAPPDWITAGTPPAPSTDVFDALTPVSPPAFA
jgi:hypothetical protein